MTIEYNDAKKFAETFSYFYAVAQKIIEAGDADARAEDAKKRLANVLGAIDVASGKLRDAQSQAEAVVSKARDDAKNIVDFGSKQKESILTAARTQADRIVADATGNAEVQKRRLEADCTSAEARLKLLKDDIYSHVSRRDSAKKLADEQQATLDAATVALSAIKAKL